MISAKDVIKMCRVSAGKRISLQDYEPGWEGPSDIPEEERRQIAHDLLTEDISDLAENQQLLYASDSWSVLVIFQAIDGAGKDSTIKHVMSGINPQGCQVYSFKQPSQEELDHDFLWRCHKCVPERGRIGIFNRSYYEEVLVVRVHPEYLAAQRLPDQKINEKFWQRRYRDINRFEKYLTRNGTRIVKFFLQISPEEQRQRFLDRLSHPEKRWKFSPGDLKERALWNQYQSAYEEMLSRTSTKEAPWYVIPADHKWVARSIVAKILVQTIEDLKLTYPKVSATDQELWDRCRLQLEAEAPKTGKRETAAPESSQPIREPSPFVDPDLAS